MHRFQHFDQVDVENVKSYFVSDRRHRAYLLIPFLGKQGGRTLCVIGQNPSAADEHCADRTVHYLEKYIHKNLPQYRQMVMLNLYSRVDTKKIETSDLQNDKCLKIRDEFLRNETDFLIVCGQSNRKTAYDFPAQAKVVSTLVANKAIFKFDIGTLYPPHPGNMVYRNERRIGYSNLNIQLSPYAFKDLDVQMDERAAHGGYIFSKV